MSDSALKKWIDAFQRRLPTRRPLAVVDVGSGTGRFTPALAATFGGPVFGVEPSFKMRMDAETRSPFPSVKYLDGTAELLPLPDASCDAALLSYVLHHVTNKDAACLELARVVKQRGKLLIRTNFSDRFPALWWYRYFPRAEEIDRGMYEPFETVVDRLTHHGWAFENLDEVEVVVAASRHEDFQRLQHRALSLFEFLSETEIQEGFAAIGEALRREADSPVRRTSDLLVLRRY